MSMKNERLRIAGKLGPSSRLGKWSPEMKGFLGIIINMGIINVPEISDYWKVAWESNIPFFQQSNATKPFPRHILWPSC